jgi:hypothetical protein
MYIDSWEWNEGNLAELSAHGVSRRVVLQVHARGPRFRRNRRRRAATHQMIGSDEGGTLWVLCIVAVAGQPGRWRAVTGWEAEDPEKEWYRRAR